MQAKQEHYKLDWHQEVLSNLLQSPTIQTRLGSAFVSVGHLLKFDLTDSFPVTTAKKLFFGQVKRELYCFLKGQTSKDDLHKAGVTIWDADLDRANAEDIGPIYGWQWRKGFNGHDQLGWAVDELIITRGLTRRAIVSAWNPVEVLQPPAILPPCHVLFQFNIVNDTLFTDVYQRSADAFLGLPFDVASFAIMSRLVANELNVASLKINKEKLNYHISNLHLYKAHELAAIEELNNKASSEKPRLECYDGIDTFQFTACELRGYNENRIIKAKLLTNETHF